MKTLFHTSLLFLMIFLSVNVKAQTSVVIGSASDYSLSVCPLPATMVCNIPGYATGYNDVTDSITMKIFWGDGNDTTFMVDLMNGGTTDYFYYDSLTSSSITHKYYTAGTFTPLFIATGPDGSADTALGIPQTYYAGCVIIDGYTYNDNNSNCIFDGGDTPLTYSMVKVVDASSNVVGIDYTDGTGYYSMSIPSGLTSLFISAENGYQTTSCPVAGGYTFNSTSSTSFDLGLSCTGASIDLYAYHTGMCGIGVPGGNGQMAISAGAIGCAGSTSATVTLTLDPLVSYVSMITGPAPTTVVGNVLTWNITLSSYSGYGSGFLVKLNTYTATTAVIGNPSCWDIDITSGATDPNMSNNHEHTCLTVGGPWDPNAKEVMPAGVGATGDVLPDTEFYYTLYFQNTGTAPAINIYVMDTISNNLDMNTFQILGSSHYMNPIFTNADIIRFDFPGINLPDSNANEPMSHGWVKYRINTKSGLSDGTQIKNTGHIYFDYNSAIVTNTTLNTINSFLNVEEISAELGNTLFPNPATNMVTVQFENNVSGNLSLVDITGKQVKQINVNNAKEILISLQELPSGFYGLIMPGVQLKQNRLQVIK
jgi:uncharacterized repeat protein (TIGR01451 family)